VHWLSLHNSFMPAMTEAEEREIREYVTSQTPPESGDQVTLVQKVGRRRVAGRAHDLYDVWMSSGHRWWVITDMNNLYAQEDFKDLDQVFTYHLGLNLVLQVAATGPAVAVRDTKDPTGPALLFTPRQWQAFTTHLRTSTPNPT
jgi:uncharacterized protein DUF397